MSISKVLVGAFAATLMVVAGAGCTRENKNAAPSPDNRQPYPPCSSNADCSAGNICTTIGCCPGCHSDADCASDEVCTFATTGGFCSPKNMSQPPQPTANQAPTPSTKTPPMQYCSVDSNCTAGLLCNNGVCQPACSSSAQCGPGQTCTGGRCYTSGASTCGAAGLATCAVDGDCGTARKCVGGTCHATCATAGSSCPLGQVCSSGTCVDGAPATAQCVFDADCGTAFRCINASCHPLCSTDSQCGSGSFCDHGVCRADYRPSAG